MVQRIETQSIGGANERAAELGGWVLQAWSGFRVQLPTAAVFFH